MTVDSETLRDRWKVKCNGCAAILEAGSGEAYLRHRRVQLPCPQCGSLDRELHIGADEIDPGEIADPALWPARLTSPAIGRRISSRYPMLPDPEDDDVIGIYVQDDVVEAAVRQAARGHGPVDPRASHIEPDIDVARRRYTENELGEGWRTWILYGPPPVSRGGYVWIGETGQFLQLLFDLANSAVTTLSTWGGAAAAVYGAYKVAERLGTRPPKLNRGAAAVIAAAELQSRYGDLEAEKLFVQPLDYEEVLSDGYVVAFQDRKRLWLVIVDRQGKVVGLSETKRPKKWHGRN